MVPSDRLRGEYLFLNIIPTGAKPRRPVPWMVLGVLIALGTALLFIFVQ